MFRFLAILAIFYLIFRVIGHFFKFFLGTSPSNKSGAGQQRTYKKPADGNINIDYVPQKQVKDKGKDYDGGEYVDFEEVK